MGRVKVGEIKLEVPINDYLSQNMLDWDNHDELSDILENVKIIDKDIEFLDNYRLDDESIEEIKSFALFEAYIFRGEEERVFGPYNGFLFKLNSYKEEDNKAYVGILIKEY